MNIRLIVALQLSVHIKINLKCEVCEIYRKIYVEYIPKKQVDWHAALAFVLQGHHMLHLYCHSHNETQTSRLQPFRISSYILIDEKCDRVKYQKILNEIIFYEQLAAISPIN